ncbi:uncharacterized protein LOC105355242 isoform X2 [Oryzias latipes]|uniref:uncharacterized protein LOC105355242 isoform X2 n=1 Tax=Oryzias latipes TaxID=8090 RepID=UPI0005CC3492|nr:uncharacterized protein LOC105355242 isoform X2 [Oryzias latipes]
MNLYSSFGNLMEVWVHEDRTHLEPEGLENNVDDSPTPSSKIETNPCLESADSGVETASCDTPCSITSTDDAEFDLLTPQSEEPSPAPTSRSPVLFSPATSVSISSPTHLCHSKAKEGSTNLKVEQVLQRSVSKNSKYLNRMTSQRSQASYQATGQALERVQCQRSESMGQMKRANSPVTIIQKTEGHRRPVSFACDQVRSEDKRVEDKKELSPGLWYLEQVCQFLEDIAQKRINNQIVQMDTDSVCKEGTQDDSTGAETNLPSCQSLENKDNTSTSSDTRQPKSRHFRQRSASDTTLATLHLGKLKSNSRAQQQKSTSNLLAAVSEDYEQDLMMEEPTKRNKFPKFKGLSSRRGHFTVSSTRSHQMQPSEKSTVVRRLSQVFRRKKQLPE